MFRSRRFVIVAVTVALGLGTALVIGLAIAGGRDPAPAGPRIVQPGAPGQSGRTLSEDEARALTPPAPTAADILFVQRMIPHHAQALEMTALVPGRSASPEVPVLAQRIETSQRDEIVQLERWLRERGQAVPTPHASHPGHSTLMPGMLDDTQLAALERARGAEFDRLFVDLMIRHHQGALVMVQELYATGGGLEPASDRFAREVEADQRIEITRMEQLRTRL